MNIDIATTYYKRKDWLIRQIESLRSQQGGYNINHFIVDDHSREPIDDLYAYQTDTYHIHLYRNPRNLGRDLYWLNVHNLLQILKTDSKAGIIMFLQDDCIPCEGNFLDIAFKLFKQLPNTHSILHLLHNEFVVNKPIPPQEIDGQCSMMRRCILEAIDYTVLEQAVTRSSTGVWRQVSHRILRALPDAKIYYPDTALYEHLSTTPKTSLLNPVDRKNIPLKQYGFQSIINHPVGILDNIRGAESFRRGRLLVTTKPNIDGLGNFIETFHFLHHACLYYHVDLICHARKSCRNLINYLASYLGFSLIDKPHPPYNHSIALQKFRYQNINNEVDSYTQYVLDEKLYPHHRESVIYESSPIPWPQTITTPIDVVLCNGAYKSTLWECKKYAHWPELAKILLDRGFSVASIGLPAEHIPGTINLTSQDPNGYGPWQDFAIINSCKLFISNDTGLYHFANLIGKRNIVIFTASNIPKNYNQIFHRFSTLIHHPTCYSCQLLTVGHSPKWDNCKDWVCTKIPPEQIAQKAIEIIEAL